MLSNKCAFFMEEIIRWCQTQQANKDIYITIYIRKTVRVASSGHRFHAVAAERSAHMTARLTKIWKKVQQSREKFI
mgnify:CR=1 FL=1